MEHRFIFLKGRNVEHRFLLQHVSSQKIEKTWWCSWKSSFFLCGDWEFNSVQNRYDELERVFVCVSRLLGLVYATDNKKRDAKKNTEHERVRFWGTTEDEMRPYTHATRKKNTHWTREDAVLSTNGHERGRHGGLKCIKARARTEKTLYTLPGRYLAPFSLRTRPKSVTVSRSSRTQYVFFDLSTSCIRH